MRNTTCMEMIFIIWVWIINTVGGKLVWVGEGAVGKQGYALLNQLKYRLLTGYQLLLIHRCYSHDYWSFFGRSFGEGSAPQNENGWYLATEAAPWAHWKFFASLDMFSFPWWKYRISKASQGIDGMFQATYSPQNQIIAACPSLTRSSFTRSKIFLETS